MPEIAQQQIDKTAVLAEACARNISAELHYDMAGGAFQTMRVRLLELRGGLILADRPNHADPRFTFRRHQPLIGFFMLAGRRYRFTTRVADPRVLIEVSRSSRVPGFALEPPNIVELQHRRRDYRLCVAVKYEIPVCLVEYFGAYPAACRLNAGRFQTRMVDLSASGFGVIAEMDHLRKVTEQRRYFASFLLPGGERELLLMAVVRHVRPLPELRLCRVGCGIETWEGSSLHHDARIIMRFVVEEQRKALARQRRSWV